MILGVTIFYDDGPELLETCLKSLKKVTDRVLAIDGAYKEFPHKDFKSSQETLRIAKAYADEVIEVKEAWKDEPAKRNAYLTLKDTKDYYLMLDADEEIFGEKPKYLTRPTYRVKLETLRAGVMLPSYYNRLFRHHPGMKYQLTHNNLVIPDGTSLTIPEDTIPVCKSINIIHRPEKRPKARQVQDGIFESVKEERKVVLPVDQKTPFTENISTPIKLKYLGMTRYHGFDFDNSPIDCGQHDMVFVSNEKADQLNKDFPGNWLLIKDLANG
jgi:hypothetical protein